MSDKPREYKVFTRAGGNLFGLERGEVRQVRLASLYLITFLELTVPIARPFYAKFGMFITATYSAPESPLQLVTGAGIYCVGINAAQGPFVAFVGSASCTRRGRLQKELRLMVRVWAWERRCLRRPYKNQTD
jgi:hypothetical protein